jgi:hypothetical protein
VPLQQIFVPNRTFCFRCSTVAELQKWYVDVGTARCLWCASAIADGSPCVHGWGQAGQHQRRHVHANVGVTRSGDLVWLGHEVQQEGRAMEQTVGCFVASPWASLVLRRRLCVFVCCCL